MDLSNGYHYERSNSEAFKRGSHESCDAVMSNMSNMSSLYESDTMFKRHQSLTDVVQNCHTPSRRRPSHLADFEKRNSASQLELASKHGGSASPFTRIFSSISTGLNRINSNASLSSLLSSSSTDGDYEFVIPVRTIPPRSVTMTAQKELITFIEKRKLKGYHDAILSEVRDGRILDNQIERPIAETISKINMWYSLPISKKIG